MAIKDIATARYMSQNEIFADAFNYFIYGGRQVIKPESLEEIDTKELDLPYGGDGAKQPVQRIRDVAKSVTAMTDNKTAYLILAVENQSNIHYAMPVRNMLYDALGYSNQVEQAVASNRRKKNFKGLSGDEYLSGFKKNDRLMPIITLVVYFGAKEWDGPVTLHEMLAEQDEQVLSLVPDYKLNLIAPAAIGEKDLSKFNSSLKEVLGFIKYSEDIDKLEHLINNDSNFGDLGRREVDVLNACVNADLHVDEKEEKIDMCLALQTLAQRAEEKGRAEGKAEGIVEGACSNLANLMANASVSLERAMELLGISADEADFYREALAVKYYNYEKKPHLESDESARDEAFIMCWYYLH